MNRTLGRLLSAILWFGAGIGSALAQEAAAPKPSIFDGGKLLATAGVSQLEGAGGGGLAPWALITGYGTRHGIGANAHFTIFTNLLFIITSKPRLSKRHADGQC